MHRVGRTLCLSIRYPKIFTELCVSYEQFVNVPVFLPDFREIRSHSAASFSTMSEKSPYLYFWLSATANSSQRLLNGFSA